MTTHTIDHTMINKEITQLEFWKLLNEKRITSHDVRRLRMPGNPNIIIMSDERETIDDDFNWILENFQPRQGQTITNYVDEVADILMKLKGKSDQLREAV